MASRKSVKSRIIAKIVTENPAPCGFCHRVVDDELTYGKLYAIGDIQCHYFCVLLSSCLVQKGRDDVGLFGFLYQDIINEIERAKKHRCSYCSRGGANLGCSVAQCRKQFHLPCGRERNAVSLFFGNYKSFCMLHAPKQSISDAIMVNARIRRAKHKKLIKKEANFKDLKELSSTSNDETQSDTQSVCVICYESVEGFPSVNTFWPPCCARDAWFHRTCLQRMALSAGMHYLKCPLCNDKEQFYQAVLSQGYYIPDRDAAWELEQNAFAEIYERDVSCSADDCICPMGRSHDADTGAWCITLCLLCGWSGVHNGCMTSRSVGVTSRADSVTSRVHVCVSCADAAPDHMEQLARALHEVILKEQEQQAVRQRGPVMPSRMSLRRTKRVTNYYGPSSSSSGSSTVKTEPQSISTLTRDDLNLKPPKRLQERDSVKKEIDKQRTESYHSPLKVMFKNQSPNKILEDSLTKVGGDVGFDEELVGELRRKFQKPQPLSKKRKIVNDILKGNFYNGDYKRREPVRQWCSPKKCENPEVIVLNDTPPHITVKEENGEMTIPNITHEKNMDIDLPIIQTPKKQKTVNIQNDSRLEISEKDDTINIDVIKIENIQNYSSIRELKIKSPERNDKCSFKFRDNKEVLDRDNVDIDVEMFKDKYLNEVGLIKKVSVTNENGTLKRKKRKRKRNELVLQYDSKKRKQKKNISIADKNIKVKIKWRREKLKLKITDSKKKKKNKNKIYKQYALEYFQKDQKVNDPLVNVTPKKRKYIKQEKSPDNLVQTSIQKFFKVKTPDN